MKTVKTLLVTMMFSITLACATNSNNVPVSIDDGLHTKVNTNYDVASIEEAMEVKGINFLSQSPQQDWVLAGVEPLGYAVGSARDKNVLEEEASIYIFDSEQQREQGLEDFQKQTEKYNMLYPRIYEKRNVLILYWAIGDLNKSAKLEGKFTNAINSLRIITEFNDVSSGDKEIHYTTLIGAGRYGGIAFEKGAAINSVDTHMNGRVHTVQIRGWKLPSSITIEYKGSDVEVKYTESPSSQKENVLVHFRDDGLDPYRIKIYLNGREQRVVGIEHGIE
jgi:hypothetical protein